MERFAWELVKRIGEPMPIKTIINRHGKKFLPAFLPMATAKALALAASGQISGLHLCDALLAPLGALVKTATGLPVSVSVHGLDITYPNPIYQRALRASLPRLDLVIAGSSQTSEIVAERFPPLLGRVTVINYGVGASQEPARLPRALEDTLKGRRVILTVGRLIRRKGAAWFVREVMPRLSADCVYGVAGDGPEREAIRRETGRRCLANRVLLTGRLSDSEVRALYRRADVFVMPNIPVEGDVEGFGLVALEAAVEGLPVVASRLDGIPDAVQDGQNGVLVEPGNAQAFAEALASLLSLPEPSRRALGDAYRQFTLNRYSWSRMAAEYVQVLSGLGQSTRRASEARAA